MAALAISNPFKKVVYFFLSDNINRIAKYGKAVSKNAPERFSIVFIKSVVVIPLIICARKNIIIALSSDVNLKFFGMAFLTIILKYKDKIIILLAEKSTLPALFRMKSLPEHSSSRKMPSGS